jgi:hypothetical protein
MQRPAATAHYFTRGSSEVAFMDHDLVVRQKMTEKYLLNELDSTARDEFEEHFFDCADCAVDVRAGAMFIEQSKVALAHTSESAPAGLAVTPRPLVKPGWLAGLHAMLRPFALPVMAVLLMVVGYQNLVTYPRLARSSDSPQVLPYASLNVGSYGSEGPVVTAASGKGFLLFMRIPPEGYSNYTAELYNPAGKKEWSLTIIPTAGQDEWAIQIPDAKREAGNYILKARGVTAAGDSKEVGQASFELQTPK